MRTRSFRTGSRYRGQGRAGGLFSSVGRLAAALAALLILILCILRVTAPGTFIAVTAPLWRGGTALNTFVGGRFSFVSRASLIQERDTLAAENQALRAQNATVSARAADLERLLGGRSAAAAGTLAGVLVRPPVSPYDVLVVDAGTAQGVKVGDVAQGPGGVPVGTVTESASASARITLYSASGRVTEGWAGANRIPVKLTGAGAGALEAEIPRTAGAVVGDTVFVPGPGALPIGTVVEIVSDPSSPTVGLRIKPMVNPFSLTWLSILPAAS